MLRHTSAVVGVLSIHWLLCWYCLDASDYSFSEIDNLHQRQKRNLPLVFNEGGTFKLLLGWAIPIMNPANVSLVFGFNFQYQYPVPPNITFFNKYYSYVNVARKSRNVEEDLRRYEKERFVFYYTLEESMNRIGINGRECLLRTICEAAETPVHNDGYFGELLHFILTPKYEAVTKNLIDNHNDTEYAAARLAGESLYDCRKLYPKCPVGHGLFDLISVYV